VSTHVPPTPSAPEPIARTIAKLCVGGDWACAHGDLAALGDIADRLADYAPETLHCELVALADQCRCDPDGAVAVWMRLKEQVRGAREPRP
jgi:hypothetical protein